MAKKENKKVKKNKTKNIGQKKSAPAASHTKGYYRFSKDFPSVTDSNGFRDNELFVNSPAKKAALRRRLSALFIAVFVIAFAATSFSFALANHPPIQTPESSTGDAETTNTANGRRTVFLPGTVLSDSGVESTINTLKAMGISAVVIDFKDASGYFYYRPSISVSDEALSRASANASSIVANFRGADIKVFASVSFYADDIYARNHRDIAAYVNSVPESGSSQVTRSIWYDASPETHAWLSPYSNEVKYYLTTVINDIDAMGVDGIIFDNVIPTSDIRDVHFPGEYESDNTTEEEIAEYISYTNATTLTKTGIKIPYTAMLSAFAEQEAPPVFSSGCNYIIPELILSRIPSETVIGNRRYSPPAGAPTEFIKDYIGAAQNLLTAEEITAELLPIIENSDTFTVQTAALADCNIYSYITYDENSPTR